MTEPLTPPQAMGSETRKRTLLHLLALPWLLAACSQLPDYQRPLVPLPAQWPEPMGQEPAQPRHALHRRVARLIPVGPGPGSRPGIVDPAG